MVIGAGGAFLAAIYALLIHLSCSVVYVVNRDTEKARQLVESMGKSGFTHCQSVIVIEYVDQARKLHGPFYSVEQTTSRVISSYLLIDLQLRSR